MTVGEIEAEFAYQAASGSTRAAMALEAALYEIARLRAELEKREETLRDNQEREKKQMEALEKCLADLIRYSPAHWRNKTAGEQLARNAISDYRHRTGQPAFRSGHPETCRCYECRVAALSGASDE
jgi:hypothetical protein